jgi:hypothetical protein
MKVKEIVMKTFREANQRLEILHTQIEALVAVQETPFLEDKMNLQSFIDDSNQYLEATQEVLS